MEASLHRHGQSLIPLPSQEDWEWGASFKLLIMLALSGYQILFRSQQGLSH